MSAWPLAPLERGAYGAIVADPAWTFASNSLARPGRNPRRHYACMSIAEISALPVAELAAPDCALFLWITGPHLVIDAHLPIMKAWGFKPSGLGFTWIKLNPRAPTLFWTARDLHMGGGFTTRKNAEFCLIGKRGRSVRRHSGVHEVIVEPRREHSRKPETFRDRVEQYVGPGVRIAELFSRSARPGWDAWGNEAGKFDEVAA